MDGYDPELIRFAFPANLKRCCDDGSPDRICTCALVHQVERGVYTP